MIKIAAYLLVRDEEDIINETLNHLSNYCDHILVLDTGSSDNTFEICKYHKKVCYAERIDAVYSDVLRQKLVDRSNNYLTYGDWFLAVSADHFFVSNPREDIKRAVAEEANVITYDVAQFYFTDKDYHQCTTSKYWYKISVQDRLLYYAINYHNFPVAFEYQKGLKYKHDVTEWPRVPQKRIASFHPILKHYQFRCVNQIKKRLRLRFDQQRKGFAGFRHYRTGDWKQYIFDHKMLHLFDGNWKYDKQPSLDELLGVKPVKDEHKQIKRIKQIFRRLWK